MAGLKTKATEASVQDFLNAIPEEGRQADCKMVAKIMRKVTGMKPRMWGPSIVGFGEYHYKYASGHEGDSCRGFSPRKKDLTLYLYGLDRQKEQLRKLGKHKTGKVCLYLGKLSDVDLNILEQMIKFSLGALDEIIVQHQWAAQARKQKKGS